MQIPRHWRLQKQRYSLLGEVCNRCGVKLFPPRDVCPECSHDAQTLYQFTGTGHVHSFSQVFDPPTGHVENTPYIVALVKLEEGPMITAQLTDVDNDQVEIGMQVEMVTRKLSDDGAEGMIVYGYKFRPRLLGQHS